MHKTLSCVSRRTGGTRRARAHRFSAEGRGGAAKKLQNLGTSAPRGLPHRRGSVGSLLLALVDRSEVGSLVAKRTCTENLARTRRPSLHRENCAERLRRALAQRNLRRTAAQRNLHREHARMNLHVDLAQTKLAQTNHANSCAEKACAR